MITPQSPRISPLFILTATLIVATGCAEADLPTSFTEPPVREIPGDAPPITGPGDLDMQSTTDDMMPLGDMGTTDASTSDMPDTNDMPGVDDFGGMDMPTPPDDMPTPPEDMNLCGPDQCTPDSTECRGNNAYAVCQRSIDGCWSWGRIETCPGTSVCRNDACDVPPMCIDNDGDTYGANCAAGPDCNDNDRNINPSRPELCDGVDNDCNNQIDDNIVGVGDACTSGQGVCEASGTLFCDSSARLLICNAQAGAPSAEICDGLDNNCDGQVDEGNTCPCGDDPNEPNDTLATGAAIAQDTPTWNFSCDTDSDFYRIPNNLVDGQQYAAMIAYPVVLGELQIAFYRNGTNTFTTALNGTDHTGVRFTYTAGDTHDIEIVHNGTMENFYRLNLVIEDTGCTSNPDFFEHNDTINTATLFTTGWLTEAYICDDEDDWYYLGNIPSGETISIETLFEAGIFDSGGDIDLELYADPQGDGTYEVVRSASSTGDDEYLTHTTSHEGAYFLRVFAYDDTSNPYEIRMTR